MPYTFFKSVYNSVTKFYFIRIIAVNQVSDIEVPLAKIRLFFGIFG